LKNTESFGGLFWEYVEYFVVTPSPEVDMIRYDKQAALRSLLITDITFRF
jgi:hypothetical protein